MNGSTIRIGSFYLDLRKERLKFTSQLALAASGLDWSSVQTSKSTRPKARYCEAYLLDLGPRFGAFRASGVRSLPLGMLHHSTAPLALLTLNRAPEAVRASWEVFFGTNPGRNIQFEW